MKSLGWALIQNDWCSYEKRRLGHRHTQQWPCEDTRRQPSISQEKRPPKDQPCWYLNLKFLASSTVRKWTSQSLSHPVHGALLWLPGQTNPDTRHSSLFSSFSRLRGQSGLWQCPKLRKCFFKTVKLVSSGFLFILIWFYPSLFKLRTVSNWFLSIARGNLNPLEQIQLPWLPFGLASPKPHPPMEQRKAVGHLTDITVSHQGKLPHAEFEFSKPWLMTFLMSLKMIFPPTFHFRNFSKELIGFLTSLAKYLPVIKS